MPDLGLPVPQLAAESQRDPAAIMAQYEQGNLLQPEAEDDPFTVERYQQFGRHLRADAGVVLDIGCATGRGGQEIAKVAPDVELWGVDVVQSRLDALPAVYAKKVRGLSTALPLDDRTVDAILAGEFLEHLSAADVDPTLCEFQRVLRVGGRLLLTTPNPDYLRLRLTGGTVYFPGHLTQHYPRVLRNRLRSHGFSKVRIFGSGKMSRHLPERFPLLPLYGSYLISADKI